VSQDPSTSGSTKPTPITGIQIVTISGSVITQTVTTMPSAATSPEKLSQRKKLSSGAVIATAVASVIAGLVLIAGVMICLFCRRRRRREERFEHNPSNVYRNTSVLSKAGLLGARASLHGVDSLDNTSPMSERRISRPAVSDQRLNPNAFMQHDDGSRTSVNTMQDNRDYTRTLNVSVYTGDHPLFLTDFLTQVRNPDPPPPPSEPLHNQQ
jgi:cell wall integrity and stress response component